MTGETTDVRRSFFLGKPSLYFPLEERKGGRKGKKSRGEEKKQNKNRKKRPFFFLPVGLARVSTAATGPRPLFFLLSEGLRKRIFVIKPEKKRKGSEGAKKEKKRKTRGEDSLSLYYPRLSRCFAFVFRDSMLLLFCCNTVVVCLCLCI